MRGQRLDVEDAQPVAREGPLHGQQREVAVVLVVDRVELHLADEVEEMRELDRQHARRLEHAGEAGDEVVEVGHVRQHVVGDHEVGRAA
jgi:hypothetical protein